MPTFNITDDDVITLGKKLNEFSEVLTDKERAMLLVMIRAASKQFKQLETPENPTVPPKIPDLGAAFDAAYLPGRAAEFENQSELRIGPVTVKGEITIGID
jgi:hypothetical protein